jgi:hypothetical protein
MSRSKEYINCSLFGESIYCLEILFWGVLLSKLFILKGILWFCRNVRRVRMMRRTETLIWMDSETACQLLVGGTVALKGVELCDPFASFFLVA